MMSFVPVFRQAQTVFISRGTCFPVLLPTDNNKKMAKLEDSLEPEMQIVSRKKKAKTIAAGDEFENLLSGFGLLN